MAGMWPKHSVEANPKISGDLRFRSVSGWQATSFRKSTFFSKPPYRPGDICDTIDAAAAYKFTGPMRVRDQCTGMRRIFYILVARRGLLGLNRCVFSRSIGRE